MIFHVEELTWSKGLPRGVLTWQGQEVRRECATHSVGLCKRSAKVPLGEPRGVVVPLRWRQSCKGGLGTRVRQGECPSPWSSLAA